MVSPRDRSASSANAANARAAGARWGRWGFGLAWGLGWATLLTVAAGTPALLQLESDLQKQVLRWRGSQPPAPEIAIVGIDGQIDGQIDGEGTQTVEFALERVNYAALALRLLEDAKARVVVLNLPASFVVPQTLGNEDLDAPLRQVVQGYSDRVVLAARVSESFHRAETTVYNHFLPFSSLDFDYLVPPEDAQGFVQYRTDLLGTLRLARLQARLRRRDSNQVEPFASVETLTLNKYDRDRAAAAFAHIRHPFRFIPLGSSGQIPIVPIEEVCRPRVINACLGEPNPDVLATLTDKIVLVGFVGGSPETFPLQTAYGDAIAAVELQGHVLSGLLQVTQQRSLSPFLTRVVTLVAGAIAGTLVAGGTGSSSARWLRAVQSPASRFGWVAIALLSYWGWGVGQLWLVDRIWPLALPLLTGTGTAISSALTLVILHNRDRLQAQQREMAAMRQAERDAAIQQARKVLYRVATDIHDCELQELKLVMDSLEVWQWEHPDLDCDKVLAQLEAIGSGIRVQLNDVRSLASKWGISDTLKGGLHQGMNDYLDALVAAGTLAIAVDRQIAPLQEATTSEWLDAREDVMRFFREAIANIVHHVHPPKGSATTMSIQLVQTGAQCSLIVSNDGSEFQPAARSGGYGTKAMNTIAQNLPRGRWQRDCLAEGCRVELHWDMPSSDRA
ncbi:MAG: CHASE2 domain-containing protein [Cyanobacteria bacterium J06639_1]